MLYIPSLVFLQMFHFQKNSVIWNMKERSIRISLLKNNKTNLFKNLSCNYDFLFFMLTYYMIIDLLYIAPHQPILTKTSEDFIHTRSIWQMADWQWLGTVCIFLKACTYCSRGCYCFWLLSLQQEDMLRSTTYVCIYYYILHLYKGCCLDAFILLMCISKPYVISLRDSVPEGYQPL